MEICDGKQMLARCEVCIGRGDEIIRSDDKTIVERRLLMKHDTRSRNMLIWELGILTGRKTRDNYDLPIGAIIAARKSTVCGGV